MLTVLYEFPKAINSKALEEFMTKNLLPGRKQAGGLQSLQLNSGDLMSVGGSSPYSKVVIEAGVSIGE